MAIMLKLLVVFLFFFGQMGLLTPFHILFDMPKEDIGNRITVTNQRGQKGYLSRQIVSKGTFDSLASKHVSFRVVRVSCLQYLPSSLYPSYLPQFEPGGIVYCMYTDRT